jgi:hypothetical protein
LAIALHTFPNNLVILTEESVPTTQLNFLPDSPTSIPSLANIPEPQYIWNKTYGGDLWRWKSWSSDTWDGTQISVNVSGLGLGEYDFMITLYDGSSNSVSDTVGVSVVDTTHPSIDHPPDFGYLEGVTGNRITWATSDLHPEFFTVFKDGIMYRSRSWDGAYITITVDGLPAGEHNFTIVVRDTSGNSVSNTVIITVESAGLVMSPEVLAGMLSFGAAIISVVGGLIAHRRRQAEDAAKREALVLKTPEESGEPSTIEEILDALAPEKEPEDSAELDDMPEVEPEDEES